MSETVLASIPNASRAGDEGARYLTFSLQGETYALDILEITEIIEFRSLTVVPMMPAFIRGVINLRGRVLPVVDLAARFGQAETAVGRRTSVIVVEASSSSDPDDPDTGIGIMVDSVNKVVHFTADDLEPAPAFGAGISSEFISGMAKHQGEFIIVLDVNRMLALDDLAQVRLAGGHLPEAEVTE